MSAAPSVRTVLGEIAAADLGPTNYHEHLFQVTPLLVGDELDDEPSSQAEAGSLRHSGFATMVDATPVGLGRRPAALARISEAEGLHVVATTGAHREPHYGPAHWLTELSENGLAELFSRDVTVGLPVADGPAATLPPLARGDKPSGRPWSRRGSATGASRLSSAGCSLPWPPPGSGPGPR